MKTLLSLSIYYSLASHLPMRHDSFKILALPVYKSFTYSRSYMDEWFFYTLKVFTQKNFVA